MSSVASSSANDGRISAAAIVGAADRVVGIIMMVVVGVVSERSWRVEGIFCVVLYIWYGTPLAWKNLVMREVT